MRAKLFCASCGRTEGSGSNGVNAISYSEQKWCMSCAAVRYIDGQAHVMQPSPGQMVTGPRDDPFIAWNDCYLRTPKKRILKSKAKQEICRAWVRWNGDKTHSTSKFIFYGWLMNFRPYFLTFPDSGDRWQTVNIWLLQFERVAKPVKRAPH